MPLLGLSAVCGLGNVYTNLVQTFIYMFQKQNDKDARFEK